MKTKTRNKKYVPKITAFPLGARDSYRFEIPFLSAIDTLGTQKFDLSMLKRLAEYVFLASELKAPDEFNPFAESVTSIYKRFERTGKVGATGDEMTQIRAAVPRLLEFMRSRTNYEIVRAATAVMKKAKKSKEYWNSNRPGNPDQPPSNLPPKDDGGDSYVPYGDH